MTTQPGPDSPRGKTPGLGAIVMEDLRTGDLRRAFRRDLRQLYEFYLDEERQERLASMRRLKRIIFVSLWLLKGLFLKLSPPRRIVTLIALFMFLMGHVDLQAQGIDVSFNFYVPAFLLLLLTLMLELKDKLLAKDELSIGRQVQISLLPRENPLLAGWEVWLYTRPANDVGGDLVDYLALGDDRLALALGDVVGKGLGAALLMAKLQATLRAVASDFHSLADMATRVNTILCRDGLPNRFATLVYFEITSGSSAVRLVNAGHLPPVLIRTGHVERLDPVAPPLGVLEDGGFVEQRVDLWPGDVMVLYSDGLSEACNDQGEYFGDSAMDRLLPGMRELSPRTIGNRLLAEVESFAGYEPLADDISLVVVKRS